MGNVTEHSTLIVLTDSVLGVAIIQELCLKQLYFITKLYTYTEIVYYVSNATYYCLLLTYYCRKNVQ